MKATMRGRGLSHGQQLEVPIAGKDCIVIEVGLQKPREPTAYEEYEAAVALIRRSFDTLFLAPVADVVEAVKQGSVHLEVGNSTRDRILASQIVQTLGAAVGRRINVDECLDARLRDATCGLVIGTHEGLRGNDDLGDLFRETLYSRYIDWDGKLISAPLIAELESDGPPVFCLIAPRPEQLAQLSVDLVSAVLAESRETGAASPDPQWESCSLAVTVPAGNAALRFRPLLRVGGAITGPGDLALVRYEIRAESNGKALLLWAEDIPPFYSRAGDGGWWKDRLISIADFAGQDVTLRFSARRVDSRQTQARAEGGFDRIAVVDLSKPK
jgi:hypothetical protein